MTCREKLAIEHPEKIDPDEYGGCVYCPNSYGYLDPPDYCGSGVDLSKDEYDANCTKCWDREIPDPFAAPTPEMIEKIADKMERTNIMSRSELEHVLKNSNNPHILDSGERREFESGAVRDIQEGKGRCDLMPLDVLCQYYYDIGLDIAFSIFELFGYFKMSGNTVHLLEILKYFCEDRWNKDCNTMFLEVSKHFEEGAKKYGEHNWQKGIPVHCYIDSAVRHYLKFLRGDKDEPHDRAFVWNIMCCIWTCKHKPELNEYLKTK